jgi:hypothetical protein
VFLGLFPVPSYDRVQFLSWRYGSVDVGGGGGGGGSVEGAGGAEGGGGGGGLVVPGNAAPLKFPEEAKFVS